SPDRLAVADLRLAGVRPDRRGYLSPARLAGGAAQFDAAALVRALGREPHPRPHAPGFQETGHLAGTLSRRRRVHALARAPLEMGERGGGRSGAAHLGAYRPDAGAAG